MKYEKLLAELVKDTSTASQTATLTYLTEKISVEQFQELVQTVEIPCQLYVVKYCVAQVRKQNVEDWFENAAQVLNLIVHQNDRILALSYLKSCLKQKKSDRTATSVVVALLANFDDESSKLQAFKIVLPMCATLYGDVTELVSCFPNQVTVESLTQYLTEFTNFEQH